MTTLAAVLQLLIALAFVSIPMVRSRYGPRAQAAAEAELACQGVPGTVLADNKLRFDAGGHETAAPVAIASVLVALAALNLIASPWAQTLTWILQPLVLIASGLILYSQLTAVKSVKAAFDKKGDPMLQRIDVPALLTAAELAFPSWVFSKLQYARHAVALGGSVAILILLAIS